MDFEELVSDAREECHAAVEAYLAAQVRPQWLPDLGRPACMHVGHSNGRERGGWGWGQDMRLQMYVLLCDCLLARCC